MWKTLEKEDGGVKKNKLKIKFESDGKKASELIF